MPEGYATRAMVQDLTGLSDREMRSLEQRGLIKGDRRNNDGWMLYKISDINDFIRRKENMRRGVRGGYIPDEVEMRPYMPEEGVSVFKLLKAGRPLEDIVLATGIHPAAIRMIVRDYQMMTGVIVLPKHFVDQINQLPIDATLPVTNAEEVYALIVDATKEKPCGGCRKRSKGLCNICAKQRFMEQLERQKKAVASAQEDVRDSEPETEPQEG